MISIMDEIISYKMCAVKVRNAKLRNHLNFVARRKRFSLRGIGRVLTPIDISEHSTTIFGLLWFIRLAALLYILRRKRHCSIQRKKLYLRMSSVLLNTSILVT